MSFDLNLDNYKYEDLVNIFQLKGHSTNQIKGLRTKCESVKRKYTEDIYLFYYKSSKALECILELIERGELQTNEVCINDYLQKIKNVQSFETYETSKLIDKLKPIEPPVIVNTLNNPIAPGKINTIKRILQTQNLHLHSCFRQNTSSSTDYQYILPTELKHIVSMRLASIEIPNTRYLFSCKQKNNTFIVCINDINHTIVIPDGNYTNESLEEYINCTFQSITALQCIHFYINAQFHSIFESNVTFSIFFGENAIQNSGWILGFRIESYINQSCIISEGLFDAIGDRYIYLSIEDYQYNTNITNIVGIDHNFLDKSILAKIPMNDEKLALIIHDTNPLCKVRQYNGPITLKKMHIKILDKFGNVIDLNNMDFSFTLELEILYENFI